MAASFSPAGSACGFKADSRTVYARNALHNNVTVHIHCALAAAAARGFDFGGVGGSSP